MTGLFHLLINGVYWGYKPITNHLLSSWDIQVRGNTYISYMGPPSRPVPLLGVGLLMAILNDTFSTTRKPFPTSHPQRLGSHGRCQRICKWPRSEKGSQHVATKVR